MPLALGIDTSTETGVFAIAADSRPTFEAEITSDLSHSSNLIDGLDRLFEADVHHGKGTDRLRGLDCIGVGVGPGSYTGLRVGLAFAKGLAFALDLPLYGVCSLEAMAWPRRDHAGPICCLVDAKMGGIYWAVYRFEGNEAVIVQPPTITPAADFQPQGKGLLLVSPHLDRLRAVVPQRVFDGRATMPVEGWPSAAYVAERALARSVRKEKGDDPLEPYYLRPSVAEIEHPRGLIEAPREGSSEEGAP